MTSDLQTAVGSEFEARTGPNTIWVDQNGFVRRAAPFRAIYSMTANQTYSTLSDYMAYWEQMRADRPDYISRRSIGQDSAGNEIWAYEMFPPDTARDESEIGADTVEPPLFVLLGGTHSSEKGALCANLIFAQNLVYYWNEMPGYARLRWGCRLVVIPSTCPFATDQRQRYNANGLDINRNGVGWAVAGTETGGASRGPARFSEPETLAAWGIPDIWPNIAAVVDHHNGVGKTEDGISYLVWVGVHDWDTTRLAQHHIAKMSAWAARELGATAADTIGFVTESNQGTLVRTLSTYPEARNALGQADGGRGLVAILLESRSTGAPGDPTNLLQGDTVRSRFFCVENLRCMFEALLEREDARLDQNQRYR